jgi:hypothetical protein
VTRGSSLASDGQRNVTETEASVISELPALNYLVTLTVLIRLPKEHHLFAFRLKTQRIRLYRGRIEYDLPCNAIYRLYTGRLRTRCTKRWLHLITTAHLTACHMT